MLDRELKRPPTAGFRQIEIGKPVSLHVSARRKGPFSVKSIWPIHLFHGDIDMSL